MSEINVPKNSNGLIFTIKSVIKNFTIPCKKDCQYYYGHVKFDACLRKAYNFGDNDPVKLTAVLINVRNLSSKEWKIDSRDYRLTDSNGFLYTGKIPYFSDTCFPEYKNLLHDCEWVLPRSQANFIEVFPTLPEDSEVGEITIDAKKDLLYFSINQLKESFLDIPGEKIPAPAANDLGEPEEDYGVNDNYTAIQHNYHSDGFSYWEYNQIKESVNQLKASIFARLNNTLSSAEQIRLENKISNTLYTLQLKLSSKAGQEYDEIKKEVIDIEQSYKQDISTQKEKAASIGKVREKVNELYSLSPREFEQYIADLLSSMGYQKVTLTPYINDGGVDVMAEKDGVRYAVQCKRYKGSVGSPEIQTFLGAMTHANADKGIFITTGMFTFEAERMAKSHPIQLINKIELGKIVLKALGYENIDCESAGSEPADDGSTLF